MTFPSLRDFWPRLRARLPRWLLILGWAGRDFVIDDGLHWSSSIAFYGVLSVFPLVLAAVNIAGRFTDPHGANQEAGEILDHVMPHAETVRDIIDKAIAAHHRMDWVSTLVLLYAGGRAFSVLIRALNVACDLDEIYGYFQRLLVETAMLGSVGLFFLGLLLSHLVGPELGRGSAPFPQVRTALLALAGWTLPSVLLLAGFFCLYKFVPRRRCHWQSALLGALAASVLCLGAKPLFGFYVGRLASYNQVYGWLTIGIVLMIWAEVLAIITLYGGELASHIQMIVYDGLGGEEVSRRHRARSPGRSSGPGNGGPE